MFRHSFVRLRNDLMGALDRVGRGAGPRRYAVDNIGRDGTRRKLIDEGASEEIAMLSLLEIDCLVGSRAIDRGRRCGNAGECTEIEIIRGRRIPIGADQHQPL